MKWDFLTLRLRNFLYFLKRKLFLYFQKWNPALFKPELEKQKKIFSNKSYYIFRKWNSLALILRNFLHFRKRKPFKTSYVSGNIFLSLKNKNSTLRKFLTSQETETREKFPIFSQKKAVLIFQETEIQKKFLMFQETFYISGSNFPRSKKFYTFSYKEAKFSKLKYFLINKI